LEVRSQKSEVRGRRSEGLKDERPTSNIERSTSNEKNKKVWRLEGEKIRRLKCGMNGWIPDGILEGWIEKTEIRSQGAIVLPY